MAAVLAAVVLALAAVAYVDTTQPRLVTEEIPIAGLTQPVDILFAADLHSARFGPAQERIARLLDGQSYDAVILGGDYVTTHQSFAAARQLHLAFPYDPKPVYELLAVAKRHTTGPVLYVPGNHDDANVLNGLAERGAEELTSTVVAGLRFAVDASLPASPAGPPSVIVQHVPPGVDEIARAREAGAGAILAAHTHGGQIALPLLGPIWAPLPVDARMSVFPGLRGQQTSGLRDRDGVQVLITRGLGTIVIPVRLFSRAELVHVRFVPAPSD